MSTLRTLFAYLFVSLSFVCALGAADLGAIRQRMDQRLPKIDEFKASGTLGENNRGYLEARGSLSAEGQQILKAENDDRGVVYSSIAQQTGTSSEQVGRSRASKIAANSRPGVWLQKESGEWTKK